MGKIGSAKGKRLCPTGPDHSKSTRSGKTTNTRLDVNGIASDHGADALDEICTSRYYSGTWALRWMTMKEEWPL